MSDNTEQPADGAVPRDPWAPPDNRVPLDKKDTADTRPPAVHDQQAVTPMPPTGTGPAPDASGQPGTGNGPAPMAGFGAPPEAGQPSGPGGWYGPGAVPPPPVGPNGPGQPAPPHAGQYGYPAAAPPQQPAGQYGYPAPQAPQYGGYPGYPGYGQNAWGGPQPANGLGIASMVLGIIAVAVFCMYGLGVILGILALIFGLIGRGRVNRGEADNGGVALAGIILGSIGIVVSAAFLGMVIWAATSEHFEEESDSGYEPMSASLVVDSPVGVVR
ncbi:DUF4190 domain-containing protein [Streptomyces sp. NBC_01260]|uniref:DUF4190 domain-containing protein n=1 Tax=unclassified Streptomyces TaxID=2593676 RepID=UPI000F4A3221|nr:MULTISPECIES: DUF4190 domain-containing protein [unclassified Streptomyces]MCX4769468.1 DUF4190 domain-containing protein [Streptomyces sp. NBC_01285]ROQ76379.1 uncharacterized protein DUF4190 [Streptomyces sp. CEV 2-1]RPK42134.1 hypothetical protein EES39_20995 [Streptomyces sp. ADI92-24]